MPSPLSSGLSLQEVSFRSCVTVCGFPPSSLHYLCSSSVEDLGRKESKAGVSSLYGLSLNCSVVLPWENLFSDQVSE